ncbi:hypothetical protein Tco_0221249 [Tanacetum coccineum]
MHHQSSLHHHRGSRIVIVNQHHHAIDFSITDKYEYYKNHKKRAKNRTKTNTRRNEYTRAGSKVDKHRSFTVNLKHAGISHHIPFPISMVGYESKWVVDLYVWHFGYDVMDYQNSNGMDYESGDSSDTYCSSDEEAPLFVSWSTWWFRDSLAYLKLSLGSSIYRVWKLIDTPYRAMWDTAYWGFLGVRTTVGTDTPYLLDGYGVLRLVLEPGYREPAVMSYASSAVTFTFCPNTYSEPGKVFWGADEELSDGGSPREPLTPPVLQDEDEREPMFIQPHDPDYVPESMYPEYIPLEDKHVFLAEEQPLPLIRMVLLNYPMDGGEDGDDDDGDSSRDDVDVEDEDAFIFTSNRMAEVERLLAIATPPPSPLFTITTLQGSALLGLDTLASHYDSQRVDLLMEDRIAHQETVLIMEEETYASREAWAHAIGLSQAIYYELHTHREQVYTHESQLYAHQTQLQLQGTLIQQIPRYSVTRNLRCSRMRDAELRETAVASGTDDRDSSV